MMNKEQVKANFIDALKHIDEGEQIVSVIVDETDELAVTMEPEIRRGKEYYTFGFQGHAGGEDLSDILLFMISKDTYASMLKELGGVEGICEFFIGTFIKGAQQGRTAMEEVPAE